jgi:hypothetical protein
MQLEQYTADDYLEALRALLPPGEAWQWPTGCVGASMLLATAQELERVGAQVQGVFDLSIERHKMLATRWADADYLRVAQGSQVMTQAKESIALSRVAPLTAGFKSGSECWSSRAKFILVVSYDAAVVSADALWDALLAFKQAHTFIWFVNTGSSPRMVWHVQN